MGKIARTRMSTSVLTVCACDEPRFMLILVYVWSLVCVIFASFVCVFLSGRKLVRGRDWRANM